MSYISTEKIDADVLIHGPCEPLWMINPTQFDTLIGMNSYNLALSHSDFGDNFIHLYQYLKFQKPPKYMLLYVTPESMDNKYNQFNTYRFGNFLADTLIANVVKDFDKTYFNASFMPLLRHTYYSNFVNFETLQGAKHWLTNRRLPFNVNGYELPVVQAWHDEFDDFIDFYGENTVFEWDKRQEKYLQLLVKLAQQKGVKVILYESPVYAKAIPLQENRAEMMAKIELLAATLDVDFWVFDDLEMSKEQSNFFSTLNTTIKGSEIFTDTLGKHFEVYLKK